jgi:hypothetical protein
VLLSDTLAGTIVEGGETGKAGGLFTGKLAEFGHEQEHGQGGARTDAGDGEQQVEALGLIGLGLDLGQEGLDLGATQGLQAGDLLILAGLQFGQAEALAPGLGPHQILFDLLQTSQALG